MVDLGPILQGRTGKSDPYINHDIRISNFPPKRYYGGAMGLSRIFKLFKRLRGSKGAEGGQRADKFIPAPSPDKSPRPTLPGWAKKDWFAQKDLGTMVPPEDLAEEASLRRPGEWLKKKLSGVDEKQVIENIRKSKSSLERKVGVSDKDIQDFFQNFLTGPEEETEDAQDSPKKGKD